MLDTLKLFSEDFRVYPGAKLEIHPGVFRYDTGEQENKRLFQDGKGGWVWGAKAYLNCENFNITVKPIEEGANLWVQFSVPKFYSGNNFYPLDSSENTQVLPALEKSLRSQGIGVNVNALRVSRVDSFRNVFSNEDFHAYAPIFKFLRAKRQQQRDYGTTFLWHNTQREICAYDKLRELEARGVTANYPKTIRFEARLKNAKSVTRALKIKTAGALFNNLNVVSEHYTKVLEGLFNYQVPGNGAKVLGSQVEKALTYYHEVGGARWLDTARRELGDSLIYEVLGPKQFRKLVEDTTGDRKKAWRAEKLISEGAKNNAILFGSGPRGSYAHLYEELREKVLTHYE